MSICRRVLLTNSRRTGASQTFRKEFATLYSYSPKQPSSSGFLPEKGWFIVGMHPRAPPRRARQASSRISKPNDPKCLSMPSNAREAWLRDVKRIGGGGDLVATRSGALLIMPTSWGPPGPDDGFIPRIPRNRNGVPKGAAGSAPAGDHATARKHTPLPPVMPPVMPRIHRLQQHRSHGCGGVLTSRRHF